MRLPMPSVTKGKGKQQANDDEQNITFHGVAYVNMAPLLYPGIKKIQGAYLVKPHIDSEVFERTKRKGNLVEEAAQISSGINRMVTPSVPAKLAASKTGAKDTKAKVWCDMMVWCGVVGCGVVFLTQFFPKLAVDVNTQSRAYFRGRSDGRRGPGL